jgi:hypothetical protein
MACPGGYELRMVDGAQRCVNKLDPNATINLVPLTAVEREVGDRQSFSIADLQTSDPDAYTRYSAEQTRFNAARVSADLRVSHQSSVDAAARDVLAANGNDPTANMNYAEQTSDPATLSAIYQQIITRDVNEYINQYHFLNTQVQQQQQTLDMVNSVKNNIGTVKDDMDYSVTAFEKQIEEIRNQININKKLRAQAMDYGKWITMGLNGLIVIALLYLLFSLGRRTMGRATLPQNPVSPPNPGNGGDFITALAKALVAPPVASAPPPKKGWLW